MPFNVASAIVNTDTVD